MVWFCYAVVKASKHQPFILSSRLGGHGVLLGSPGAFQAFFRGRSHSGPPYAGHTPSRQRSLAPGGNHLSTSSWPTPGGHPSGCGWYSWPVVVCGRTSPPALCQSCSTSSWTGMATLSLCAQRGRREELLVVSGKAIGVSLEILAPSLLLLLPSFLPIFIYSDPLQRK